MLNIHIICLGKLKETYWLNAETEYLKRLKPYAKITMTELPEEAFSEKSDRDQIKCIEAEKIKKHLKSDDIIFALHEAGKEYTSPAFAEMIEKKSEQGQRLVFVIGGPLGLHSSLLETATTLSLSKLTFPHQMVRTILLEQLYRSVTIQKGKQYHY